MLLRSVIRKPRHFSGSCLNSAVRWTLWAMVAAAVLLGALATTRLLWAQVRLGNSDAALAKLDLPAFAGHIEAVRVGSSQGSALPVALRDGELWPPLKVRADQRLTVSVTVRRPSWAAWLVGRTECRTFTVVTPDEQLRQRLLHVPSGSDRARSLSTLLLPRSRSTGPSLRLPSRAELYRSASWRAACMRRGRSWSQPPPAPGSTCQPRCA